MLWPFRYIDTLPLLHQKQPSRDQPKERTTPFPEFLSNTFQCTVAKFFVKILVALVFENSGDLTPEDVLILNGGK